MENIILPQDYRGLPGYVEEMNECARLDNVRSINFISRFCSTKICDIPIKELTMKQWLVLHEDQHNITKENFSFSDCIKFLYTLAYGDIGRSSLFLRVYREHRLIYKINKYIKRKYPTDDIETKFSEIIKKYWDGITHDIPGKYSDSISNDKNEEHPPFCYYAFLIAKNIKNGLTESEILNMPVGVFYQYNNAFNEMSDQKINVESRRKLIDRLYYKRFVELKELLKEKSI